MTVFLGCFWTIEPFMIINAAPKALKEAVVNGLDKFVSDRRTDKPWDTIGDPFLRWLGKQ